MTANTRSWNARPWTPAGTRLLFVHGLLHGAWCWPEAWRDFFESRGFSTRCLSLPGHDRSTALPGPPPRITLAQLAAFVANAADSWPAPVLIGHSLGALLIQMCLRDRRPPAAILLAPTHPMVLRRAAWRSCLRQPARALRAVCLGRLREAVADEQECRRWFFSSGTPDDVVARCFESLEEEPHHVLLELLLRRNIVPKEHLGTPVLVLGAGRDGSVPRRTVERVARLYGVRAEFFEELGHDMMMEPGWEEVAGRIVTWLGSLGLGPQRKPPRSGGGAVPSRGRASALSAPSCSRLDLVKTGEPTPRPVPAAVVSVTGASE